jgi:glycosyltransferase involved in cell wall biosynthesis
MRILIVNHEFPPVGGGAATASREMAAGMATRGHKVRVLTGAHKSLPSVERRDGYDVYRLPALRRSAHRSSAIEILSFGLTGMAPALSHFRKFRPDVCIAFFGLPAGLIAAVGRTLFGVPYVVSLRGGDVPGFAGVGPYARLALPLILPVWKGASAVVANSPQLQRMAGSTATRIGREVSYIPNGVDLRRFRRKRRWDPSGAIRALFVGRLATEKGLETLLRSLALLRQDTRARLQLTIVGDGPLRKHLESLAGRIAPAAVSFQGWRARDELPAIYASADLLVLPSLMEGMPNVVLEAMATGLGIVATNVGGSRELVRNGENGLLAQPGSVRAMATALSVALQNKVRLARWGEASSVLAKEYGWDAVVDQYLKLFEKAAARGETLVSSADGQGQDGAPATSRRDEFLRAAARER